MKSFSSLVHGALFPSTRVYHDANGNYKGYSTDITPILLIIGRVRGILLWLYVILTPLLAPVYFIVAHWFCRKYDADFMREDPDGWQRDKHQILRNHRNILIGWIIFMIWGYCVDWGQNSSTAYYKGPYKPQTEYTGDPYNHKDPYR